MNIARRDEVQKRRGGEKFRATFLVFVLGLAGGVKAGLPLVDRVPADAVVYAGWAGTDRLAADYAGSDLRAVFSKSNVPDVVTETAWEAAGSFLLDPADGAARRAAVVLWHHPTAVFLAGSKSLSAGLICDAGDQSASLASDLKAVIEKAGGGGTVWSVGGLVTVTAGVPVDHAAGSLRNDRRFMSATKRLAADPAVAVYVNVGAVARRLDRSTVLEAGYAWAGGFDRGQWVTASALVAAAPRAGLLKIFEPAPIDPVLMSHVPAGADSVSVTNLDAATLFDTLESAAKQSHESDLLFHRYSGMATVALGRNFRRELLQSLGPQWVTYEINGEPVVVNRPTDPATAADAVTSAVFGLVGLVNRQFSTPAVPVVARAEQKTVGGVALTTARGTAAAPTTAVTGGLLYLGWCPEAVTAAVNRPAEKPGNDPSHTPAFSESLWRLNVPAMTSFEFHNLPATAETSLAAWRRVLGGNKIVLPTSADVAGHVTPALWVCWADGAGVYTKSVQPFPGSNLLLGNPGATNHLGDLTAAAVAAMKTVVGK